MYSIQTDNQYNIMYRSWETATPEAVFLLVHGLGAHSGRWSALAEYFFNLNFSSYAIELRGFGETQGLTGHIDSLNTYYKDIQSLYSLAREENPDKKIFIVSESMGALLSLITCAKCLGDTFSANISPDGLICISPAFSSKLKFPPLKMVSMLFHAMINSQKHFELPFDSRMCTRDEEMQKIMDADPNESRIATAPFMWKLLCAQISAKYWARKVRCPAFFLNAGEDHFVYPHVSQKVFHEMGSGIKMLTQYSGMYHSLSVEKGREEVFEDIRQWVDGRL